MAKHLHVLRVITCTRIRIEDNFYTTVLAGDRNLLLLILGLWWRFRLLVGFEKRRNKLDKIIKNDSLHWPPLCWNYTSRRRSSCFWFEAIWLLLITLLVQVQVLSSFGINLHCSTLSLSLCLCLCVCLLSVCDQWMCVWLSFLNGGGLNKEGNAVGWEKEWEGIYVKCRKKDSVFCVLWQLGASW